MSSNIEASMEGKGGEVMWANGLQAAQVPNYLDRLLFPIQLVDDSPVPGLVLRVAGTAQLAREKFVYRGDGTARIAHFLHLGANFMLQHSCM